MSVEIAISLVALIVASSALLSVIYLYGRMAGLYNAPVLRQYVERFVPIDDSDKGKEILAKKVASQEAEFDKMYGLGDVFPVKTRDNPEIRVEDTV